MPKREATPEQLALRIDEIGAYVSAKRAAEMLDVSQPAISQLVQRGKLRVRYWAGMTLMIERASVEEYRTAPSARRGPAKGFGGRKLKPKEPPSA